MACYFKQLQYNTYIQIDKYKLEMAKIKKIKKKKRSGKTAMQKTFLYVLMSLKDNKFSYVGVTNDISRRIRQHNGEIVGGAKYTSRHAPWRVFAMFELRCRHDALSLEWKVKHKKIKSDGIGIQGRINAVKRLGAKITGFRQFI